MQWFQHYWWVVLAAVLLKMPVAVDVRRFDELYHADLIGVEELGGPVEQAMVNFRRKCRGEPGAPDDPIDQLSLQLAQACETEMRTSEGNLFDQQQKIAALATSGAAK